ncbi:MAG: cupin domain-containing protein [Kofleriaceae bacterium]|nr:cupin domain-containing protein [Kofleriaceae bacterium]MCB9570832.1 cupin domain-containing protein [Kofleriaceae bacterium]
MTRTKPPKRTTPRPPIATSRIAWAPWAHGARFGGRVRVLSSTRAGAHVGVLIEELPPGKQSCPAHYHLSEEEHIYVLDGEVTLRLGDARHRMKAGDFVSFPAGQAAGHCLINDGDRVARYLVVGESLPHDVCVYTDTDKVNVRALGEIYDRGARRDYWEGEPGDAPAPEPVRRRTAKKGPRRRR